MTIEELLLPRYKVTADYPDSEFQVGEILLQCKDGIRLVSLTRNMYIDWFKIDKYPHLFKKLEWWEERGIEDLPMYLKDQERIWKLKRWDKDFIGRPTPVNVIDGEGDTEMSSNIAWFFRKDKMLPATAEEYESFKSKTIPNE